MQHPKMAMQRVCTAMLSPSTGSSAQAVLVTERVEHGCANEEHGHALVRFLRLKRHHAWPVLKAFKVKMR